MEEYMDYRQVRGTVLAIAICMAFWFTLYMGYSLVQNFLDIFAISLVTSLAIRPCKDYIHLSYLLVSTSTEKYPILNSSLIFRLRSISSWVVCNNILLNIIIAVVLGVFYMKLSFMSILVLFGGIALVDLFLRAIGELALKVSKICKLNSYSEFFDMILTIILILAMVAAAVIFQTIAFGTVILEISEHGRFLFDWMSGFFDAESLEGLRNNTYFQTLDKNAEQMWENLTFEIQKEQMSCSTYIEQTRDLPLVSNFIFEALLSLEEFLAHLKLSSHQILTLYSQSPEKFHELCWKIIFLPVKLVLSNVGGVAIAISTIIERVVLYFTLVYILVKDKTSILEKFLYMVPLNNEIKNEITTDISSTVAGISTSFVLAAISHYLVTLLLYMVLELELKHTFSVLTAVVGLFPFFGAWFVNLPMIFWLLFRWDYRGIVILLVEYLFVGYLDGEIYSTQLESFNPTLLGIVIVLGIYKFGTFGIFYGPLIMSIGYLIFKLGRKLNEERKTTN